MFVVKYRKFFFILSALLLALSIGAMIVFGFNFGIDFKGGTISQVTYTNERPTQEEVKTAIDGLGFPNLGDALVQPTGDKSYIIRTRELATTEKDAFLSALSFNNARTYTVDRYDSVGPTVGNELKNKSYTAIAVVIVCIMGFITYAFRKVSDPVASWKYGLATVISLIHDIIIPTGIFIIYIHYTGGQIDILFISAILTVLGYSVHDTIVVFDRVRENLSLNKQHKNKESFETTVGRSVSETFGRSINTSLTIFFVLVILFFYGGETTKDFSFVLLLGVIIGTYSSIFVASPLLVTFAGLQSKKKAK